MAKNQPAELQKQLGLFQVSVAGIGIIMGAGVYVLIGQAAKQAGGLLWVSFIVAGAVSACTALSYAELSAMFPRAGASFEFARRAFNIRIAFLTGWFALTAEVVGAAAVALGFGEYVDSLFNVNPTVAALVLLAIGALIGASGILRSVWVASVLTFIEVGGLLAVAGIGFVRINPSHLVGDSSVFAILGGAALLLFAYIGFEDIATFAEEVKQPERTLPRATLVSLTVATVVYGLIAVASVGSLGAAKLGASDAPVAAVAEFVMGGAAGNFLAVIAIAATAKTTILLLVASSRRVYAMSTAGVLPGRLARVSGRTHVPIVGVATVAGIAAVIALSGNIAQIAGVTNFALFVAFTIVNLALIVLRRTSPDRPRPFRVPGEIKLPRLGKVPIFPLIGMLVTIFLLANLTPVAMIAGGVIFLTGLAIMWALRGHHSRVEQGG